MEVLSKWTAFLEAVKPCMALSGELAEAVKTASKALGDLLTRMKAMWIRYDKPKFSHQHF
jgi:hypothetical protein